jgi:hypothetical protein
VVVDSGSSLIILPAPLLNLFYEALEACLPLEHTHTSIKCACATQDVSSFPTMTFNFNETVITLEPSYYIQNS